MKPRRDLTVSPEFIDDVGKQEAAIAWAYSLSDQGDMTLVAAAKNENRQAFEILVERHARRIFFAARRMTRTREWSAWRSSLATNGRMSGWCIGRSTSWSVRAC